MYSDNIGKWENEGERSEIFLMGSIMLAMNEGE